VDTEREKLKEKDIIERHKCREIRRTRKNYAIKREKERQTNR
jgi:hypothetical protein